MEHRTMVWGQRRFCAGLLLAIYRMSISFLASIEWLQTIRKRISLTSPLNEADILQLLNKMSFDNLIEEVSDVGFARG